MKFVAIALGLAVFAGGNVSFLSSAQAGANCTCRHAGGDTQEGQTACIKSPKGMTMAKCERVLNNTSWKMLDMPCPFSQLEPLEVDAVSVAAIDLSTPAKDKQD